ncbi:MAG TPA: GNAT family protein [Solirubrobacteraceae bacterium]
MEGQPLGEPVAFSSATSPNPETVLRGQRVLLRRPAPDRDARPLFDASHPPSGDPGIWTYMNDGPYATVEAFAAALAEQTAARDPQFRTIIRLADRLPVGICSYLAIVPEHGTIEIGNIWFATSLQRTTEGTEAIQLLLNHAFDELGYRRVEWKCNALNARSRAAAERFGFRFEGVFAQHRVVKGRNRDTAWYAITDNRWQDLREAYTQWLSGANFDDAGNQRRSLRALTAEA